MLSLFYFILTIVRFFYLNECRFFFICNFLFLLLVLLITSRYYDMLPCTKICRHIWWILSYYFLFWGLAGVVVDESFRYSGASGTYYEFNNRGLMLTRKLLIQWSLWLSWNHHFESFMIATIIVTEDQCHKWPRKCSVCRNHNRSFPTFMTYLRF